MRIFGSGDYGFSSHSRRLDNSRLNLGGLSDRCSFNNESCILGAEGCWGVWTGECLAGSQTHDQQAKQAFHVFPPPPIPPYPINYIHFRVGFARYLVSRTSTTSRQCSHATINSFDFAPG